MVLEDHDINDGGLALGSAASIEGAWVPSQDGLALEPGGSGRVLLPLTVPQNEPLGLKTWFYAGGGLHNLVECSSDGRTFVAIVRDRRLVGDLVALEPCLGSGRLWLRFSAALDAAASGLRLSLDKIQIVRAQAMPLPEDGRRPAGLILLSALMAWLVVARPPKWVAAALAGAVVLTLRAVVPEGGLDGRLRVLGLSLDGTWLASGAALGLVWLGALTDPRSVGRRTALARLTLLWIVGAAAFERWSHVLRSAGTPLDPDAITVVGLAEMMRGPYDTSFREPMWLWAAKGFESLVVHPEMALRLFSFVCSVGLVITGSWLARRAFQSEFMGLAVAWFLAGHPYLTESAARGLRTELNALCLAVVAGLALATGRGARAAPVALGTALVVATLTQLNSLAASLPILAVGVWQGKIRWWAAATAIVVTAAAVAPHLVMSQRRFGDPFWSLNVHGIWYRNYEFVTVAKTGCRGCPTPEELARDSYAGERVTMAGYVFGMHSPREVAQRLLRGYLLTYVVPSPLLGTLLGSTTRLAWVLYILGLVLLLRGPGRELLLVPIASLNLLAFVVPLGLEPRLVMSAVTVVAIAACRAIAVAWDHGIRLLREAFTPTADEDRAVPS